MFLAYFLAIASIAGFAGLLFAILLADAVFTDQIRSTAIGGVAEVPFAAKGTIALLWDVRVQGHGRDIGESCIMGRGKVLSPVEIAA